MKLQAGSLMLEDQDLYFGNSRPTIKITPKEARLLALLMQSPGQVVSRAKIMKEVWHTDYLGDTRTLDVHICWLRQKIEENCVCLNLSSPVVAKGTNSAFRGPYQKLFLWQAPIIRNGHRTDRNSSTTLYTTVKSTPQALTKGQ